VLVQPLFTGSDLHGTEHGRPGRAVRCETQEDDAGLTAIYLKYLRMYVLLYLI